jgi:septal ring factor EnvC (AmiA/AmiB activator)
LAKMEDAQSEMFEAKREQKKKEAQLEEQERKLNETELQLKEQERKLNETELQLKATTNPDEKKELREDINRLDARIISLRNLIAVKEASLTEMRKLAAAPIDPSSSGIQGDHLHPPSLTLV